MGPERGIPVQLLGKSTPIPTTVIITFTISTTKYILEEQ